MARITISLLASTVLCSGVAIATVVAPTKLLAQQIVYPATSEPNGVMVTGQGTASVPADVAEIQFLISSADPEAPNEGGASSTPEAVGKTKLQVQVTETSLKPIVAAIAATGIPASAIQVSVDEAKSNRFNRRSAKSSSTGAIRVTLEKPSKSSVQKVVYAGDNAAKTTKLFAQEYLKYRVNDCTALEKTAYTAAVNDAQRRAQAIASAINVQLAEHPSIAEAFYTAFYPSTCNPSNKLFYPNIGDDSPYTKGFVLYSAGVEANVETRKDIFVTYKIK